MLLSDSSFLYAFVGEINEYSFVCCFLYSGQNSIFFHKHRKNPVVSANKSHARNHGIVA